MTENQQADLVVIGGGASGICAALTAGLCGAEVTLFEKMPSYGGMTNFAEAMFAVESKIQKRRKIGLTVDEAYKTHMESTHWQGNGRLIKAFMSKSADTIDWLEAMGVAFSGSLGAIYPDAPRVWHMLKGLAATALIKPLINKAREEKNIRVFNDTPVKRLILNKGKIAGVIAEDKQGNVIETISKAVVIASGGYQDNKDWVKKYCKGGQFIKPFIQSKQTGDGIQMAWDAGAAPDGLGVLQSFMVVPEIINMKSHLLTGGMHPYLWINKQGERFCDESIVWKFPWATNALAKQPEAEAFCIFDENTKRDLKEKGAQYVIGELLEPMTKLTKLDKEMASGEKKGNAFSGPTIKALAEKIKIIPQVLQTTVDEYNACYDERHDFAFSKDRKYLQPVRTPNFYAVKLVSKALITDGGIKINHKTEVLTEKNDVIPGLYAVGCCAGGTTGDTYVISTTGASLCFAVNSGRIAGENVLEYLRKNSD